MTRKSGDLPSQRHLSPGRGVPEERSNVAVTRTSGAVVCEVLGHNCPQ